MPLNNFFLRGDIEGSTFICLYNNYYSNVALQRGWRRPTNHMHRFTSERVTNKPLNNHKTPTTSFFTLVEK